MSSESSAQIALPELPATHDKFIEYIAANPTVPIPDLLKPYNTYDSKLREVFAQQPNHTILSDHHVNLVPLFDGNADKVRIRARMIDKESEDERNAYILPLSDEDRKADGSAATVSSLKEFKSRFAIFSESALADMDWSNVVVAGSAVLCSLLPVPSDCSSSKRTLREYFHEKLAPASDVDLFIYGLDETQAIKKIEEIEHKISDSILSETTAIRTKNAITIVSQYPTRHVQIVLRIYKSVSEILTGFDVDCSCVAYDGKQIYASPRALAAFMTQTNTIDLTRRSPSYENRLSKYSHKGFEVYWPLLDRSRIDPTIFERSFGRTVGLARLLVLEKLPKSQERDLYQDKRREERGQPRLDRWMKNAYKLRGNFKDVHEDEIPDWIEEEEISNYHTFSVPYGPKFHAKKIEKLFYKKDLLLNAEWNRHKDRDTNLHRHPAFFGSVTDVIEDCCGSCPNPLTEEDEELAEAEKKIYVSGKVHFLKDNPGRQAIGSFNPLTEDDWIEMAYVGNTDRLFRAIVDCDLSTVQEWLRQDNRSLDRRDHTGRTPLHAAITCSTVEIVHALIDGGARLVARLVDGRTALHLAAMRGSVEMVSALLRRSEYNKEKELERAKKINKNKAMGDSGNVLDEDGSMVSTADSDSSSEFDNAITESSYVKLKSGEGSDPPDSVLDGNNEHEPDIYDVNVIAWDTNGSPLHLAIVNGHTEVVKALVQDFGADVLLPVKLKNQRYNERDVILNLVLAFQLPLDQALQMIRTLAEVGASAAQADKYQTTVLHYCAGLDPELLKQLYAVDKPNILRAINHVSKYCDKVTTTPLITSIRRLQHSSTKLLLEAGASVEIDFHTYMKSLPRDNYGRDDNPTANKAEFRRTVKQPLIHAVESDMPSIAMSLLEAGADVNTLTAEGWAAKLDDYRSTYWQGRTVLDVVQEKLRHAREYEREFAGYSAPLPLDKDDSLLEKYPRHGYTGWAAKNLLERGKAEYARQLKQHEKCLAEATSQKGLAEKKKAIAALVADHERLEAKLQAAGARTFQELHPNDSKSKGQDYYPRESSPSSPKVSPFNIDLTFRGLSDLSDGDHSAYIQLYEAVWDGDLSAIKSLTLAARDSDHSQPPLKMAVTDSQGVSPFALAIYRGYFEIAKAILEIVRAQYTPPEVKGTVRRTLLVGHDGHDSDGSDDSIQIFSELIDDKITVENIGEMSLKVESSEQPLDVLRRTTLPFELFPEGDQQRDNRRDFVDFAISHNNKSFLVFYLDLIIEHQSRHIATGTWPHPLNSAAITNHDFIYAIKLERIELLYEMTRLSGVGVPFYGLFEESGVVEDESSTYYQGLSVHGKKRKDWANADRGARGVSILEHPPLLHAAYEGSLQALEWFLSPAPKRCYMEYAEDIQNPSFQKISQMPGGFEKLIDSWLNTRSHLAMHCVVMSKSTANTVKALKLLIDAMPSTLNAKSSSGLTPLQLAFGLCRADLARVLISAGADQTCRDFQGNNILHTLLSSLPDRDSEEDFDTLQEMLSLIDTRIRKSLATSRSSDFPGSATPLSRWLHRWHQRNNHDYFRRQQIRDSYYRGTDKEANEKNNSKRLGLLLEFSDGAELDMVNGEGDTPLHVCVRYKMPHHVQAILQHSPALLLRENASGRTPYEMAELARVAHLLAEPPKLPQDNATDMVHRRPQSFVEDKNTDSAVEMVWQVCRGWQQRALKGGVAMKRKLVSLDEANEVARRLAEQQLQRRSGCWTRRDYCASKEATRVLVQYDEVERWYHG